MRRVTGLFALGLCACLVAGCGDASLAKAREVVGDPHAGVVDVETPELLDGQRLTVIVLKPSGSTGLGCIVAQSAGGSLVPGCPRSSWEAVGLNPKTHAYAGDWETTAEEIDAIAKARETNARFMTCFPGFAGLTVRCDLTTHPPQPWVGAPLRSCSGI